MIGDAHIGRDVPLGSNVHLLSGKTQHNGAIVMANVGQGCVIGAGSGVVSDIPNYPIAAWNPARVIRLHHHQTPCGSEAAEDCR